MVTSEMCECGRNYTHCRICGARSVYIKKFRSMEFSQAVGRQVSVYGCRVCGAESNITEPCNAPKRGFSTDFKPKQPESPQEGLIPSTKKYAQALREWVIEAQERKGYDRIRVWVEAKKAGWALELFEIDEDVKQVLIEKGLLGAGAPSGEHSGGLGQPAERDEAVSSADSTQAPLDSPVSLDEIIKNMQEGS